MYFGNPIRGEAPFSLNGSTYTLCYDWHALSVMSHHVGRDVNFFDPETIATAVAIGLSKHHPGMTPRMIFDASPPLGLVVNDFNLAMRYCYYGHRMPPERDDDEPGAEQPDRLEQITLAFSTAFRAGISPADFWGMTPHQTNILVQANSEMIKDDFETLLAASWHTAVFSRIKEIPPLKSLMRNHRDPTLVSDEDDDEQRAAKQMMAAFMGATKVKSIKTLAPAN